MKSRQKQHAPSKAGTCKHKRKTRMHVSQTFVFVGHHLFMGWLEEIPSHMFKDRKYADFTNTPTTPNILPSPIKTEKY